MTTLKFPMQSLERVKFGTIREHNHFDGARAFKTMHRDFRQASTEHPNELHEFSYLFGERCVRMRVVGRELAEYIVRPFSHLRSDGKDGVTSHLTIELWDRNLTGVKDYFHLPYENGEWYETTLKTPDGVFIGQQLPYTLSCLDRRRCHIVASILWNESISNYERAKPLARLLLEWYNDQDLQVIHAALVVRNGQGVLIAGKRRVGKSTFSLACVSAGFEYVSEDFVALEKCSNGLFVGHSLYNSVFLERNGLARFGDLGGYAIESGFSVEEKSAVILSQVFPERLKRSVPIRVLVLPRITVGGQARFWHASKGEALLALGPSSLLQIPNKQLGARGFKNLSRMVEGVPCYWLEIGANLQVIPACVEALLAK